MTKREQRKIEAKDREWQQSAANLNNDWYRFWRHIKIAIRDFIYSLMFIKKPSNKIDIFGEEVIWWLKIIVIFFALKGFTYWLTGR